MSWNQKFIGALRKVRKITFIGGVHGVGKTTLCNKILKKIDINHYSASDLIKRLNKDSVDDKSKNVTDISKNQDRLITAIDNYVDKSKECLIDGHFCLFDLNQEITKVPENIFKKIDPSIMVIVYDNIKNIQRKNSNRDAVNYDKKLLDNFQRQELAYSKHISEKLDIPYMAFDVNTSIDRMINFIKKR